MATSVAPRPNPNDSVGIGNISHWACSCQFTVTAQAIAFDFLMRNWPDSGIIDAQGYSHDRWYELDPSKIEIEQRDGPSARDFHTQETESMSAAGEVVAVPKLDEAVAGLNVGPALSESRPVTPCSTQPVLDLEIDAHNELGGAAAVASADGDPGGAGEAKVAKSPREVAAPSNPGPGTETHIAEQSDLSAADRAHKTEQLVVNFHMDVYRYALWLSGCVNAAEDITQETFLRAFRGLHRLREEAAAKGWLMTITRNEFARWCKKSKPGPATESEPEIEDTSDASRELENSDWLNQGLKQLPNEFRLVIVMYYFEQLSYAQISQQLAIPIGTVMSRLSRGRRQLREALKGFE